MLDCPDAAPTPTDQSRLTSRRTAVGAKEIEIVEVVLMPGAVDDDRT